MRALPTISLGDSLSYKNIYPAFGRLQLSDQRNFARDLSNKKDLGASLKNFATLIN